MPIDGPCQVVGVKKIYFNLFSSLGKLSEPACDNQLSHELSKKKHPEIA